MNVPTIAYQVRIFANSLPSDVSAACGENVLFFATALRLDSRSGFFLIRFQKRFLYWRVGAKCCIGMCKRKGWGVASFSSWYVRGQTRINAYGSGQSPNGPLAIGTIKPQCFATTLNVYYTRLRKIDKPGFVNGKEFVKVELRKAEPNEVEICYQCIEDARAYHQSLGFAQWRPDYPTRQTIVEDIAQNIGYAFVNEQGIIGYCCILIGDEPAYHKIEGAWKTDRPYAVVHRMAFNQKARGRGLSKEAIHLIKELCLSKHISAIRVDTQDENKVMQHILVREGFAYCGRIQFGGGPKLAYEWDK